MAGKSGATRKDSPHNAHQQGNLGQKEALQEKRSESELAHMGELSRSEKTEEEKDKK
jgi:hypothetical protein